MLQSRLGHAFRSRQLLERALTHPSYAHENSGSEHNERLEFLGDAVLQLCATLLLMQRFPSAREGELSARRARVVSTEALAAVAEELQLGLDLRLGVGEEATGGRGKPKNLANALEAVLGATYVDGGLEAARALVARWVEPRLGDEIGGNEVGALQELTQRRRGRRPAYEVVAEVGPAGERRFAARVLLDDEVLGSGVGRTKQIARREAARRALDALNAAPEGPR